MVGISCGNFNYPSNKLVIPYIVRDFYKFKTFSSSLQIILGSHPKSGYVTMVLENGNEEPSSKQIVPAKPDPEDEKIATHSELGFCGHVEFDLGPVYHPSFGSIHIKSSFPRLQPRNERPDVTPEDLSSLQSTLLTWVKVHFDTEGKEKYFSELTLAATHFTTYVNPLAELYSPEMDLGIKLYFWLWIQDDMLENMIEEHDNVAESMRAGTEQLLGILDGKYDAKSDLIPADAAGTQEISTFAEGFKDVENFDFFKSLFTSLLDLHQRCGALVPNYATRVKPSRTYLAKYFEAMRWYAVDQIDGRYSEDTFRVWRRIIAYFDGIAEVVALLHGVTLPPEIVSSPIFCRMLEIANSFGGFKNDLLGMKKEFQNGQKDSLVIFKVLSKGQPLEEVVTEICTLIEVEMKDFLLLKRAILKDFKNEENLVKYLDIMESMIDGHNRIYAESTRHRTFGCIKLTR